MLRFFRPVPGSRSLETRVHHIPPEVRASVHPDGLVLVHWRKGLVYTANTTGALIWQGLVEQKSLGRIGREISRVYGTPVEQATEDAIRFAEELQKLGFLRGDRQ